MYKTYIKPTGRATVAVTQTVRTGILEAAYVLNESQHSTKIRYVRADYSGMEVTCKRDAIEDPVQVGTQASVLPYIVRGQVYYYGNIIECNTIQRS